jgi:hypothetical protein
MLATWKLSKVLFVSGSMCMDEGWQIKKRLFDPFLGNRYCTDEQGRSAIEIVKASGGLPEMIAVLSGTKSLGGIKSSISSSSSVGMNNLLPLSSASAAASAPNALKLGEEKEKRFKKNKKKEKNAAGANTGTRRRKSFCFHFLTFVFKIQVLRLLEGTTKRASCPMWCILAPCPALQVERCGKRSRLEIWGLSVFCFSLTCLQTTMSQFGTVRQVRMTPKSTFAFVEYETVEEAVAAVNKCQGEQTF